MERKTEGLGTRGKRKKSQREASIGTASGERQKRKLGELYLRTEGHDKGNSDLGTTRSPEPTVKKKGERDGG